MPIIKANAYGHGLTEVARALEAGGADWLGVARIEEALAVRQAGVGCNLLVLGYVSPLRAAEAAAERITLTAFAPDQAAELSAQAAAAGLTVTVHAKIDIGMGRLGVFVQDAAAFLRRMAELPGLKVTGMFTHFPLSDEPENPLALRHVERMLALEQSLREQGLRPPLVHACNSAAAFYFPTAHFDMVRSGIAIYGLNPSDEAPLPPDSGLIRALTWKSRLVSIKEFPAGQGIGYNYRYTTTQTERIGTAAVGYCDGIRRRTGNFLLVGGKIVPVRGGMCMDQCMVSLLDLPDARVGDEVVVIGRQGEAQIAPEDLGRAWNTNNYDAVCSITARVPRLYFYGNHGD